MNNKKRRNQKKGTILIIFLCLFTVLFLGICIIRDNKIQKEQSEITQKLNNEDFEKKQKEDEQEEKHQKALRIYDGLILSTLGDSITGQATWQPYVVSQLGFSKYNNYGKGGTKVSGNSSDSIWQDARINEMSSDSNVIIFMGGTNDWSQNVELSDINSKNTNTFYGALNIMTDKLKSKFPNAKIIFMSTTFAKNTNRKEFNDKVGFVNNIGLKNIDYGLAIKHVAETRGITFIDLTSLWNETNIGDYVTNEKDAFIHPNDKGGQKIAKTIVDSLREQAGVV